MSELAASLVEARGWGAHTAVHEVFDRHLEGLFGSLEDGPLRGLDTLVRAMLLRRELFRHLELEERVILPACRGVAAEAVPNVRRDHRLIRAAFERLEEMALWRVLERVDVRLLEQSLVHLDRLLDHHDDREADALYGPLEHALTAEERLSLLALLADVALLDAPTEVAIDAVARHGVVDALVGRYRAWLVGGELASVALDAAPLPPRCRAALPKLLARDDHVVRRARASSSVSRRERAGREMLVSVSLRSTVVFVLEALLDG